MGIDNLPGSGINFRASSGVGNFKSKLSNATRYGELSHLRDNREAVVKAVKKYEGAIKIGKFSRLRQKAAYNQIRRAEGNKLTKDDKEDVKKVLEHLGSKSGSGSGSGSSSSSSSSGMGPEFKNRIQRANVLSATRGYEASLKLGSSASAKMIQAKAFKKLEEAGGGTNNRFSQGRINTGFSGGYPANPDNKLSATSGNNPLRSSGNLSRPENIPPKSNGNSFKLVV